MALSACAASLLPGALAPNRSSFWVATPIGSKLAKAFGATDVVSERGEEAVERVRALAGGLWRPFGPRMRRHRASNAHRRSASRARAAPWAASASLTTRRSRIQRRCSTTTSALPAAPLQSAHISRNCSRTCLRARSNQAASSTGSSALQSVPDGYRAMNERRAIKVMVEPVKVAWTLACASLFPARIGKNGSEPYMWNPVELGLSRRDLLLAGTAAALVVTAALDVASTQIAVAGEHFMSKVSFVVNGKAARSNSIREPRCSTRCASTCISPAPRKAAITANAAPAR